MLASEELGIVVVRSDTLQSDASFKQKEKRAIWQGVYEFDRLCFCRIRFSCFLLR